MLAAGWLCQLAGVAHVWPSAGLLVSILAYYSWLAAGNTAWRYHAIPHHLQWRRIFGVPSASCLPAWLQLSESGCLNRQWPWLRRLATFAILCITGSAAALVAS